MADPQSPISEQEFNNILAEVVAKAPKGLSEDQFNQLVDSAIKAKTAPKTGSGFVNNAVVDAVDQAGNVAGFGAVMGRETDAVLHPEKRGYAMARGDFAQTYPISNAALHPLDTLSAIGSDLKHKYVDNLGQTLYEHPIGAAMDTLAAAGGVRAASRLAEGGLSAVSRGAGRAALKLTPLEEEALPEMLPTFQAGNANVSGSGVRRLTTRIDPLQDAINGRVQAASARGVRIDPSVNPALDERIAYAERRLGANQPNYDQAVQVRDQLVNAPNTSRPVTRTETRQVPASPFDPSDSNTRFVDVQVPDGRTPVPIDPVLNTDLKRQFYQNVGQKYLPNAVDDARSAAYKAAAHDRMAAENAAVPGTRALNDQLGPLLSLRNRINSLLKPASTGVSYYPTQTAQMRNVISQIAPYAESLLSRGAYQGARGAAGLGDAANVVGLGQVSPNIANTALGTQTLRLTPDQQEALRRAILGQ